MVEPVAVDTPVTEPIVAEVAALPAIEVAAEPAPVVDQPAQIAASLNDAGESTLVRAMESFGSAPQPSAPAPVAAPAADLQSTLADSGLVMVETSAERAAGIEPVIVEQPQLGRRRRAAPVIANEPMQQVETRNE